MQSHNSQHTRLSLIAPGIILVLALLSSCVKEEFKAENLDTSIRILPGGCCPHWLCPLPVDELLDSANSTQFSTDDSGFMTLVYRELLESGTASDLIRSSLSSIPTVSRTPWTYPSIFENIPDSFSFSDTLWIPVTIGIAGDARIDSVIGASLNLTVNFVTHFNLMERYVS